MPEEVKVIINSQEFAKAFHICYHYVFDERAKIARMMNLKTEAK